MDSSGDRSLDTFLTQPSAPAATTISTIVLQSNPLQLVVGLLRVSVTSVVRHRGTVDID